MNTLTAHEPPQTMHAWMDNAACAEIGTDIFFPEPGDMKTAAMARRICAGCPVTTMCADYARRHHIRYGIFGGKGGRTRNRTFGEDS